MTLYKNGVLVEPPHEVATRLLLDGEGGFGAFCTCGWNGPDRRTEEWAKYDAEKHRTHPNEFSRYDYCHPVKLTGDQNV